MVCPDCGARLNNGMDKCPLCGAVIDRGAIFRELTEKGDGAFALNDYARAGIFYRAALDMGFPAGADIYMKYGSALDKQHDRAAAEMYLKAISVDLYNERAHSLLALFYDNHKKLPELKAWYEKSRGLFDAGFVDKQAGIIDSMINLRKKSAADLPAIKKPGAGFTAKKIMSMVKRYIILNIFLSIAGVVIFAALMAVYFLKTNMLMAVLFGAAFLLISSAVFMWIKRSRRAKIRKSNASLQEILDDFKAGSGASGGKTIQ